MRNNVFNKVSDKNVFIFLDTSPLHRTKIHRDDDKIIFTIDWDCFAMEENVQQWFPHQQYSSEWQIESDLNKFLRAESSAMAVVLKWIIVDFASNNSKYWTKV